MPRKERARISITGARPVREGPDRPCPTVPATKATERRSWLELGVGSEAVVYARGGKADAEDGIAFGEPVGELLADAGLDFGHAVGGRALPFFKFGGEVDVCGTLAGIGSEFVEAETTRLVSSCHSTRSRSVAMLR